MPHQKVLVGKEDTVKKILQLHPRLALLAERPCRITHPPYHQAPLRPNLCPIRVETHQLDAVGQAQDRLQTDHLLNPYNDSIYGHLILTGNGSI